MHNIYILGMVINLIQIDTHSLLNPIKIESVC